MIQGTNDVCHEKTDLKVFVVVIPKEGWARVAAKDAATVYTNTGSCTPGFHTAGWRKFSASSEFLNFENRTIIKRDMTKKVSEDKI